MSASLKVTADFTADFKKLVDRFKHDTVLVGIPEERAQRTGDSDHDQINNATLFAIANFGSPKRNIPPWPIMAIGIRNAQKEIAAAYLDAAKVSLRKGLTALDTYYNRAGQIAATEIKKVINSQQDVPGGKPEESTLEGRKNRKSATGKPSPFKGTKYWLVTGQLRNAITYVIGGRK